MQQTKWTVFALVYISRKHSVEDEATSSQELVREDLDNIVKKTNELYKAL